MHLHFAQESFPSLGMLTASAVLLFIPFGSLLVTNMDDNTDDLGPIFPLFAGQ